MACKTTDLSVTRAVLDKQVVAVLIQHRRVKT